MSLDLAAIKARLAAATSGEWWNESGVIHSTGTRVHPANVYPFDLSDGEYDQAMHDAELIANAPADLRALVARVEALEAALSKAHAALELARPLVDAIEICNEAGGVAARAPLFREVMQRLDDFVLPAGEALIEGDSVLNR